MKKDIKFIQQKRNVVTIDSLDQLNDIVNAKEKFFETFSPSLNDGEVLLFRCKNTDITKYGGKYQMVDGEAIRPNDIRYVEKSQNYETEYFYIPATVFVDEENSKKEILFPYGLNPRSIEEVKAALIYEIKHIKKDIDRARDSMRVVRGLAESNKSIFSSKIEEIKKYKVDKQDIRNIDLGTF